jgi:hypothetical protein
MARFFSGWAFILTMVEQSKGLEELENGLRRKYENRISSKPEYRISYDRNFIS